MLYSTDPFEADSKISTNPRGAGDLLTNMAAKRTAKLTKDQTEYLINQLQTQTGIWDVSHKDYKVEGKRLAAWILIQEQMKAQFGLWLTVDELKTKYSSYRTAYMKELHREIDSKRSGAAANEVHQRKYEFFHQLDFLRRVCQKRPSLTNVSLLRQPEQHIQEQEQQGQEQEEPEQQDQQPLLFDCDVEVVGEDEPDTQHAPALKFPKIPVRRRKSSNATSVDCTDAMMDEVKKYLTKKSNMMDDRQSLQDTKTESTTMVWARALVADIDSIKNDTTRELLKMDIVHLVHTAQRQELASTEYTVTH